MGNECNLYIHQKRTFLPMLCSRSSIKDLMDVANPTRWDQESSSSSSSISGDPLSPRVGCMGQVQRTNKVSGFPSISHHKLLITSRNNNSSGNVKYLKLKKLFSGKNLSASTTPASTKCGTSNNKRIHVEGTGRHKVRCSGDSLMSVVDMDPPLPVIKKEPRVCNDGQEGDNLWKRRCRGAAAGLKTLELQQLQLSRHSYQQPTTV